MKIIAKSRDIKPGETVLDRGNQFTIAEVRVCAEHGLIVFIDTEGVRHGGYHPDEYLGVGEYRLVELSCSRFSGSVSSSL